MSRVYRDRDKYEQECLAKAKLAREGRLNTHEIQQQGVSAGDWVAPEGWTLPAMPEKEPQASVSPARIDVVPTTHTTPLSTYELQRMNYIVDDDTDCAFQPMAPADREALLSAYGSEWLRDLVYEQGDDDL